MNIKIVTDSTSDIPSDVAQKLGIVVVPVYVRFGDTIYLDGVEISNEELSLLLPQSNSKEEGEKFLT